MDSHAEQNGQYVVDVVESMSEISSVFGKQTREILAEHGIEDPSPDEWYSGEAFMEGLNAIRDEVGPTTVSNAGVGMSKSAPWPPEIDSVKGGLQALDEFHQAAVRGAKEDDPVGHYLYEELDSREVRMSCSDSYPYPQSLAKGVFKGVVEHFAPDNAVTSVVEVDPNSDEKAAFEISW